MCYKYINKYGTAFIWCEIANGKKKLSSYLRVFEDCVDDYFDHYIYCPYCGSKLEIKEKE